MYRKQVVAVAMASALVMAGCGSEGEVSGSQDTMRVQFLVDETGIVSAYAIEGLKGAELAVEQANESGVLGDTELELDVKDTASDPTKAVSLMQEVARSDAPVAVYGLYSAEAVRLAPLAQQTKIPLVLWQSGGEGTVDVGNYVYRTTPPQASLQHHVGAYLTDEGAERVATIFNSDVPTLIDLAENTYPEMAESNDFEIVKSIGIPATATDVSTVTSQLLAEQPDAVSVLLFGTQAVSVVNELRRSGYEGIITTQTGVGLATLEAMGDAAEGIVLASEFLVEGGPESTQEFVEAFEQKYDKTPDNYAWSGYDAMRMVIEALSRASDFTREDVQQALIEVSEEGFDGAIGRVTFEERDARAEGGLLQWTDGKLVRIHD